VTAGKVEYRLDMMMRKDKAEIIHRVTRAGAAAQSIQNEAQMQMWSKKSGRKVEK
jgi:hypothetical protein